MSAVVNGFVVKYGAYILIKIRVHWMLARELVMASAGQCILVDVLLL